MSGRIRLVQFLALTFWLSLTFAPVGAAQDVVATIHKQAWKIDPTAGAPVPGREKEFEAGLQPGFIEVFRVLSHKYDQVEVYLFQEEDGFFITNTTCGLSLDKDGKFTVYGPDLELAGSHVRWDYRVKDADTLVLYRPEGTFIYKRVPDFNPPKDELTGIMPLPWQDPDHKFLTDMLKKSK